MSTDLSRLLHQETDRLPVGNRPAAAVRARAERSRRVRRAGVAALTSAAAVVVLVVSTQLGMPRAAPAVPADLPAISTPPPVPSTPRPIEQSAGQQTVPAHYQLAVARKGDVVVVYESTGWADRPHRTLAIAMEAAIPGQRGDCGEAAFTCQPSASPAAERPLELAPDPLLTDAQWVQIAAGFSLVRTGSGPAPLVPCPADPAASNPASLAGASYADLPASKTPLANEFVLQFADDTLASGALVALREQFVSCFAGTDWLPEPMTGIDENVEVISADVAAMWGYDEAFFADRHLPG